jgi:hypothetical protein
MEIAVLVEPVASNGFRAICGEPWRLESEAPTRAEALQKLRQQLEQRVAAGAEVVAMTIGDASHPLAPFAGMLQDEPLLEPWRQAMADYREGRDGGLAEP